MLEYDRIDASEGTDINKTNASNECDIIGIFQIKALSLNHIFAMVVII